MTSTSCLETAERPRTTLPKNPEHTAPQTDELQKKVRDSLEKILNPDYLYQRLQKRIRALGENDTSSDELKKLRRLIPYFGDLAQKIYNKQKKTPKETKFLRLVKKHLPNLCLQLVAHSPNTLDLSYLISALAKARTGEDTISMLTSSILSKRGSAQAGSLVRTCSALARTNGISAKRNGDNPGANNLERQHTILANAAHDIILKQDVPPEKRKAYIESLINSYSAFGHDSALVKNLRRSIRQNQLPNRRKTGQRMLGKTGKTGNARKYRLNVSR